MASAAAGGVEPAEDADSPPADARAQAAEILRRVEARPVAREVSLVADWRLIDASGLERTRRTRIFRRDARGDAADPRSKWLVTVDAPASIEGTALLLWSAAAPGGADEQWLYLPSFRKVRRIGRSDREEPFIGSDFSLDDLRERSAMRDDCAYLRSEPIDGVEHLVLECIPPAGQVSYARRTEWIDPRSDTRRRSRYVDAQGRATKTLDEHWTQVGGFWVWERMEMKTERSGHRTVVEFHDVKIDPGLPEDLFTATSLRLGVH